MVFEKKNEDFNKKITEIEGKLRESFKSAKKDILNIKKSSEDSKMSIKELENNIHEIKDIIQKIKSEKSTPEQTSQNLDLYREIASLKLKLEKEKLKNYSRLSIFKQKITSIKTNEDGSNKKISYDDYSLKIVPYIFLVMLALLASNQYFQWEFVTSWNWQITVLTIITGIITFWNNRKKIEKEVENEKDKEEIQEEIRKRDFQFKFPRINKIPIVKGFAKWMYKEGWIYSVGLVLIIILAGLLYFNGLGNFDFREDEFQVLNAATNYHFAGTFYRWSWIENKSGELSSCNSLKDSCKYDRAWPHTWLISKSFDVFGISEWSARLISVLFGILFIILSYGFVKFFTESKPVALMSSFAFVLYPSYISIFRYTRMYALLIPLFLILTFLIYRGLTNEGTTKAPNFIKKNFDFDYRYLISAFILTILLYIIHINSLIIFPGVFLFVIYLAITRKERKYILSSILGSVILIILSVIGLLTDSFSQIINFISFFGRNNIIYLDYLTKFPFISSIGIVLLISVIVSIFFIEKRKLREKLVYLSILIVFSLGFFIYIADRYSSFVYISHITPLAIILILYSYIFFKETYGNKKLISTIFIAIFLLSTGFTFFNSYDSLYINQKTGDISEAYKVIIDNYNPEKEVIFAQYLRAYYLKDIEADANIINMLKNKEYKYSQFKSDLKKYNSGWIIWETKKGYHINSKIIKYVCKNFKQLHGEACKTKIDNTKVEVFYFNKSMLSH